MATHAGAPDKPPPPPSNQLAPERFAERTLVLLDSAEGLLARCHRLDRTLRSNDKCRAVREPEWKGLRSKLAKSFPALPDLSKVNWDDDVVFRNQTRTEPKKPRRFVNDTVRRDFHRRFLTKYIQ